MYVSPNGNYPSPNPTPCRTCGSCPTCGRTSFTPVYPLGQWNPPMYLNTNPFWTSQFTSAQTTGFMNYPTATNTA